MILTDFFIFRFYNSKYIRTKLENSFFKCNILIKFAREKMENISVLKQLFDNASVVSAIVHTHPDGDALGSGAALVGYLSQRLGKDAILILPDKAPDKVPCKVPDRAVRGVHLDRATPIKELSPRTLSAGSARTWTVRELWKR